MAASSNTVEIQQGRLIPGAAHVHLNLVNNGHDIDGPLSGHLCVRA